MDSIFRKKDVAFLSPLCLVWFSNQLIKQQHSRWWKAVLMSTLNFILPWWGSTSAIKMDRWQREGRERDRDVETEAEAMTGATKTAAFLVRLSVSWEAKKASQLHASFITEPHYQWHPHWGTRMQNVTTIQLLPRIGFFRRGFCIGRRVSVLFLKQRVDLFLFYPRTWNCISSRGTIHAPCAVNTSDRLLKSTKRTL